MYPSGMSYQLTVPPITKEEHHALVRALMAHKGRKPFSKTELNRLERWARRIRFQVFVLDLIVAGKASAYVGPRSVLEFDLVDVEKQIQDLLGIEAVGGSQSSSKQLLPDDSPQTLVEA